MEKFNKIFNEFISKEYNKNNENFGLSEIILNEYQILGDITLSQAKDIYKNEFYDKFNLGMIKNSKICGEIFNFGANIGSVELSIKLLQRSYNTLNKNMILKEDGILGEKTISNINQYKFYKSLYKSINILQGSFYISLSENNENLKVTFIDHEETEGDSYYKEFFRLWVDGIK